MRPSELLALAETIPGCLSQIEMAALLALALEVRSHPGDIVEVGALFGKSTVLLTAGGHVTTIDCGGPVVQWMLDASEPKPTAQLGDDVTAHLHRYLEPFRPGVTVAPGLSELVLPTLSDRSAKLVFLDGDHCSPAVDADIRQAMRLVQPGGILVLHDFRTVPEYQPWPDVQDALWRAMRQNGVITEWPRAMFAGRIGAWYRLA
ncbi:MAG TPA: class I SAM-dependent methyltransferase [Patescibacteria group bacterium]|nr:class I SAM-dependent methyltransferase [Patescibacteria group bacterium]